MRHLPENFRPIDQLELTLTVEAELIRSEPADDGRLMSVRVLAIKHRSNNKPVLWSQADNGDLCLEVEAGAKQRLKALGLSSRQRESLKERLAGLSATEAGKLLAELGFTDRPDDRLP